MRLARRTKVIAGVLVFAVATVALKLWTNSSVTQLKEELTAIRAMGIPTEFKELAQYARKSGTNAGPLYTKFSKLYEGSSPRDSEKYRLPYGPMTLSQAHEFRKIIPDLIQGSRKERWVLRDGDGNATDSATHFITISASLAHLARLAVYDSSHGHVDDALEELRADERIVAQKDGDPGSGSGAYGEKKVIEAYQQLLINHQSDPAALKQIANCLQSFPPMPSMRVAMIHDFVRDLETLEGAPENFMQDAGRPNLALKIKYKFYDKPRVRHWETLVVDNWLQTFRSMQGQPDDWRLWRKSFETAFARHASDWSFKEYFSMDSALYDCDTWGERLARRRLVLTATRVLLAHARTGVWPPLLPTGDDTTDPFTNKPLEYKATHTGFLLYSFGRNRMDDRGAAQLHGSPDYDLVVRIGV